MYRAMQRFGELIMQCPSESEAKTTEPGQREARVWALYIIVSTGLSCCGAYDKSGERFTSEAA